MPTSLIIGNPNPEPPRPGRAPRKTRSFSAHLLASIEADVLWPGGQAQTDVHRPVAAWFAGSEDALRPFVANLREGRRAVPSSSSNYRKQRSGDAMEFLKTAGYQVAWQRYPEGSVACVWIPELFVVDPGILDDGAPVVFVTAPAASWASSLGLPADQQQAVWAHLARLNTSPEHDLPAHFPELALAWAAQLDRRVRWPLLSDPRFAAQLLVSFLASDRAYTSSHRGNYSEVDVRDVGLLPGVATRVTSEDAGALVAHETERFFDLTGARAKPLLDPDERCVMRDLNRPMAERLRQAKIVLRRAHDAEDMEEAQDWIGALERLKKRGLVDGDLVHGHNLTARGKAVWRACEI